MFVRHCASRRTNNGSLTHGEIQRKAELHSKGVECDYHTVESHRTTRKLATKKNDTGLYPF